MYIFIESKSIEFNYNYNRKTAISQVGGWLIARSLARSLALFLSVFLSSTFRRFLCHHLIYLTRLFFLSIFSHFICYNFPFVVWFLFCGQTYSTNECFLFLFFFNLQIMKFYWTFGRVKWLEIPNYRWCWKKEEDTNKKPTKKNCKKVHNKYFSSPQTFTIRIDLYKSR